MRTTTKTESPDSGVPAGEFRPSETLLAVLLIAQERGAIGQGSLAEHIDHASAFVDTFAPLAPDARRLLDLGTGGGLPGLVIAERCPELEVVLLDGRTERIELLREGLDELGWGDRVEAIAERAETAAHRNDLRFSFDVVVARSFAQPAVTAECAAGFLRVGGVLVISEPPPPVGERWPEEGIAELGLRRTAVTPLIRAFAALRAISPVAERFPRRVGIPAKRPLF
jgi:16S rRNA (guanine527-N7)-methyltransferase